MKKQTEFDSVKIDKEELNELTIVQETIARDLFYAKNFSVIDLWNIRRQGKTTRNTRKTIAL